MMKSSTYKHDKIHSFHPNWQLQVNLIHVQNNCPISEMPSYLDHMYRYATQVSPLSAFLHTAYATLLTISKNRWAT